MATCTTINRQANPIAEAKLNERLARLMQIDIDFIANAQFEETPLDAPLPELAACTPKRLPADLPPHLGRLCKTELLSREDETALFRAMNLLKYQAYTLRANIAPESVTEADIEAVELRLERARAIRDHIIQANMRLVMAVVKKFVTPQESFDELLSDGTEILMQAIEKFDFDRGFRFSTYAYRSIARNAYRKGVAARKEEAQFTRDAEEWAFGQDPDLSGSSVSDQMWSNVREVLASMLGKLDRRERFIVRSRYALGSHREVRTFQCLADKLGVSKERVRQLEQRAVNKLKAMASEMDQDEIFAAAFS